MMIISPEELEKYFIAILKHSMEVHYYLYHLGLQKGNSEVIELHDLDGENNKLEKEIALRLVLGYKDKEKYKNEIQIGVERHRKQRHHQILKEDNPNIEEYYESIVDIICAGKENRPYHNEIPWKEIIDRVKTEFVREELLILALKFIEKMQNINEPNLKSIDNLKEIPNIGFEPKIHQKFIDKGLKILEEYPEITNVTILKIEK